MEWQVAKKRRKRFKLFLWGPEGCFKTRTALRLCNNNNFDEPTAAIIDVEMGSDHYGEDFAFFTPGENFDYTPDNIYKAVKTLVKDPGPIKNLIFDSFSVYYQMLMEQWVDRFLLRERTSKGNKGDYYTMQPRDYVHVNRDASKLVRLLLKCDLNVICICQQKEKWGDDMKVAGSIFDGWKRLPYYFDTIIEISKYEKQPGFKAQIGAKDRSNFFKIGEKIPWTSDEDIYKFFVERIGHDFSEGPRAVGYDPDAKKSDTPETDEIANDLNNQEAAAEEKPVEEKKQQPETKATEPPAEKPDESDDAEPAPETAEPEKAPGKAESTESKDEDVENQPRDYKTPVTKEKLMEIVAEKKKAKINDPEVWARLIGRYDVASAKEMTMGQADDLIGDLVRIQEDNDEVPF